MCDGEPVCDYCGLPPSVIGPLVQGNADRLNPAYICWGCVVQVRELLMRDRLRRSRRRSQFRDWRAVVLSHPVLNDAQSAREK
jgi:hypothetical protein